MKTFSDIANPWIKDLATYESGRPIEEVARELGFESVDDVFKLASNENALGPSQMALEAMHENAAKMHRYPDGGAYYLKQALAEKLNIEPEQLLPTNGSNEVLELLGHVFLGPNAGIVMADCAFVVYKLIAAIFQANVVTVPMKNFTHDLDAMLEAIRPETRLVFISNPNNPTSTMVDEQAIDVFMSKVPDHVVVCFDEAYIELLPPEKQPDTLKYVKEGRSVVLLRTFSKTYGLAGLRIGYAIAPSACIDLLGKVRQPFNVNAMAMTAAIAALKDEAHLKRTREMIKEGLTYFEGEFSAMGLSYVPAVVNFILVKVGNGREVFEALKRQGLIVRPMDCYGLPGYVRITVGTREENERCVRALKQVLAQM